MLYNS
jgi:hypothetical protein